MKKIILSLIFIFYSSILLGNTQRILNRDEIEIKNEIAYAIGESEAFTGIVKKYHKNGNLENEVNYVNGKIEGLVKIYYESGALSSEINFFNNLREGMTKEYYETGELQGEYIFKNDLQDGIAKEYFETGELGGEYFFVNGKKEGIAKEYYRTGELAMETPYVNDDAEGVAKEYYETGELKAEIPCKNNFVDGTVKEYFKDGSLRIIATYKKGIPDGEYIEYKENGKIKEKSNFIDGEKEKTFFDKIKKNWALVILGIIVFFIPISLLKIFTKLPSFKMLDEYQKEKILKKLIKYNNNDGNLHSTFKLNGFGTGFYRIRSFKIGEEKFIIFAKMLSALWIPMPYIFGYLVCFEKDKILSSISKEDFKKFKQEIEEEILHR